MSKRKDGKRRDHKGRILRRGESQRKDLRHAYVYTDSGGKQNFVYSWKLEPTDALPRGKRPCISLREKEKEIERDILDGLSGRGRSMTVYELTKRYLALKSVKETTRYTYENLFYNLSKEAFASLRIDKVTMSVAKAWLVKMQVKDGKAFAYIKNFRNLVKPAFQMAVDDDLIRKKPFNFNLASVIINDEKGRQALTELQKKQFLEFVKQDKHYSRYYDGIYILFHTGMRISEMAGLTPENIDFDKNRIIIDHQLHLTGGQYVVTTTKTSSGVRILPMSAGVKDAFVHVMGNRKSPSVEMILTNASGKTYHGFLFLRKDGIPMVGQDWTGYFKSIVRKYNRTHPVQMPMVTPHVCRHTYCSDMAKTGINVKVLQYLMGHADIGTTLNIYTHVNIEDAEKEIQGLFECNPQDFEKKYKQCY